MRLIFQSKFMSVKVKLKNLAKYAGNYGNKAFLAMDPFLKDSEIGESIIKNLKDSGKEVVEYYEIVSNPTTHMIDKGIDLAIQEKCDFVIGVGGGSAIDTAKAVALLVINGGKCWDYTERLGADIVRPEKPGLPLIAVATTSGTGSEATPYCVILNPDLKQKCAIINPKVFPTVSIVDPKLTVSKPPELTALTGIDAFSHAFESCINVNASPFSEMVALESIRLFAANIEEAVKDGTHLGAREGMALCSTFGGMAIAHAGTSVPHALGQPLSGLTNAPHGGSIAACISEVVKWTLPDCEEKFAKAAEIFEPALAELATSEKAAKLPEIVDELFERIGVDVSFKEYGLKEEEIEDFCEVVFNSFQIDLKGHPKAYTKEDLVEIVKNCMD